MPASNPDRVKLTAWVSKGFRHRFKTFCLNHGAVEMQDVLRAMVEKLISEGESKEPSLFVKEILAVVTPASVANAERGKVLPMPPHRGGGGKR